MAPDDETEPRDDADDAHDADDAPAGGTPSERAGVDAPSDSADAPAGDEPRDGGVPADEPSVNADSVDESPTGEPATHEPVAGEPATDDPSAGVAEILLPDDGASEPDPGAMPLEPQASFVLGLGPLKSALESLVFVSDKPLTDRQLAELAHASVPEVRMAMFELVREYEGRGIELKALAGGYQFRSAAKNAGFVRKLVAPKPVRLSRALLETLSIVAYRQPVTRPEIDDVRGVDSGEALKTLADRDLIRILGRKEEPGRPLLYGTTKHFLEFFGLNSLRDLPTLREYAELTDESRSIFERRMGEPLDLKSVQAQADAALAEAHEAMLGTEPEPDGEGGGADPGAEAAEPTDASSAGDVEAPRTDGPEAGEAAPSDDASDDDASPNHEDEEE